MTEQTGGLVFNGRSPRVGLWLTYVRALMSQSVSEVLGTDGVRAPREDFFVEVSTETPRIHVLGEDDSVDLDDASIAVLSDTISSKAIDIVLGEDVCIDMAFNVPPGLLPEVRQMIETEIAYRSPFAEDAAFAVWEAFEAKGGGWDVIAALTLKKPVDALAAQLSGAGISVSSIIRETQGKTLRRVPPWVTEPTQSPKASTLFRRLHPALQATLAGAAIFAVSTTLLWGQALLRDWSLQNEASRAQTELRSSASASARMHGLDASLAMSTEVLAVTGTLSERLPDGVWLDQLIIEGEDVTLVGFSPSAAEVTRLLADIPTLTDIRFASPVIRDNSQSLERFRIAAKIVNGGAK